MKKLLLKLAPKFVLDWLREIKEKRDLAKSNRIKKEKTITKEDVKDILRKCDIDSDRRV